MTTRIQLNKIQLYGNHGVFAEEQQIGSWYELSISMLTNVDNSAFINDELDGTVNYAEVLAIAKKEFSNKSKLLEHLAYQIAKQTLAYSTRIEEVTINIKKIAPPLVGNIHDACVELTINRSEIK